MNVAHLLRLAIVTCCSFVLEACALGGAMVVLHGPPGGDAQKNFENIVGSRVGKPLSEQRYSPIFSRTLDDGNRELKYSCCSKTCYYYYVVDPKTDIITS